MRMVVASRGAGILVAVCVAVCGGAGCTGEPNGGGASPSAATNVPATHPNGAASTKLGPGTYIGGEQLVPAVYEVTLDSGSAGGLLISFSGDDPFGGIAEALVAPEHAGHGAVSMVRVEISEGDEIVLLKGPPGDFLLAFTPVTSRRVEPIGGRVTLHSGTWSVGDDLTHGVYRVDWPAGEFGNLVVVDGRTGARRDEMLGGNGNDREAGIPALDLQPGDRMVIGGITELTLMQLDSTDCAQDPSLSSCGGAVIDLVLLKNTKLWKDVAATGIDLMPLIETVPGQNLPGVLFAKRQMAYWIDCHAAGLNYPGRYDWGSWEV